MKREPTLRDHVRAAFPRAAGARRSRCIDEIRAIAFYGGRLESLEMEEVREHLVECASCRELAADARLYFDAFAEAEPPRVLPFPAARVRRWGLLLAAATLVLAAGLILHFRHAQQPVAHAPRQPLAPETPVRTAEVYWREMPIQKAPYAPSTNVADELIWRGGETPPPARERFDAAMRAYVADDFVTADRALAEHLAGHPRDGEAAFYRGVSLLMLNRAAEAVAPLRTSLAQTSADRSGSIRWYLALALLKSGQPALALAQLDALAAGSGEHSGEAAKLLTQTREYLAAGSK